MSTPTTLFDHQAQPFWDEAGTYFPPGFDPQTGQWIDRAYEDAYAQGFVWDASIQDWAPLDPSEVGAAQASAESTLVGTEGAPASQDLAEGGGPREPPTLDDPEGERAIHEAVLLALDESPDGARLFQSTDGAARRQAMAEAITAAARRLLDAIARDLEETTAIADAGEMPTLQLVLAILRDIAPTPADAPTVLKPEITPPRPPAAPFEIAPAPRFAVKAEAFERGATQLPPDLLEIVEARDLSREGPEEIRLATLIETPPLPFDDAADAPLARQIARDGGEVKLLLKNATPLPLGFDGEIDLSPHPKAALHPAVELAPEPEADLLRKIDRALGILAQAQPGALDEAICIPLDAPFEALEGAGDVDRGDDGDQPTLRLSAAQIREEHGRLFPNAREDRAFTASPSPGREAPADDIELALTALADSAGQRALPTSPPPAPSARETLEMPLVRLKRPSHPSAGETAKSSTTPAFVAAGPRAPTVRMKRPARSEDLVEVVAPIDLPSDDIELALTALAKFVKRQSSASLAAGDQQPPLTSASRPPKSARRAPPPPLPGKKAASGKKPPLPLVPTPSGKRLSQKPVATRGIDSMSAKLSGPAAPPARSSSVPVAIALNGAFRVLCRTLDGVVHRGVLHHPNLTAPTLTLEMHPGPSTLTLETSSLQAIFFLRRPGQESVEPEGRKARLLFKSGRQRSGYIPAFDPHGSGFFFYPSETQDSPTDFWFVYGAGIASIDFE